MRRDRLTRREWALLIIIMGGVCLGLVLLYFAVTGA